MARKKAKKLRPKTINIVTTTINAMKFRGELEGSHQVITKPRKFRKEGTELFR
ncbi:hypothetical protein ACFLZ9_01420 [Patescibacteria group bacterium]